MSYRALYRQYRPASFGEMIGQEHITTILKNQVQAGQTAHAYLFAGTRGTGKTSAAKILARAVNCLSPVDGSPCGHCSACLATSGENADIIELDAASNNSVDNVRDIIDKAAFMPLELKTKVYIIDEAHALSGSAFNALLKTLEEPPSHVMFILATTEPQKIPATIISRCQRMDFHRLTVGDMVSRMKEILRQEGAEIDDEGMLAIARAAEGGMRDCLSIADQCLSFCGSSVTAEDVYSVLGSMDEGFLFEMSQALINSRADRALELLDRVVRDGRDLKVFLHDLALHMRALLITKLCGHCGDILDCTEDAMKRYMAQAENAGEARLLRAGELLLQAEGRLRAVTLPRVLIESTLVRIARPEGKRTLADLEERIELLERQIKDEARKRPAPEAKKEMPVFGELSAPNDAPPFDMDETDKPAPAANSAPARSAPSKTEADTAHAGDPKAIWKAVQKKLVEDDKPLAVMAAYGKVRGMNGKALNISFDKEIMYQVVIKPENMAKINAALEAVSPGCTANITLSEKDSAESLGREIFGSAFRVE